MKKLLSIAILLGLLTSTAQANVTDVKWGLDAQNVLRLVFDLTEAAKYIIRVNKDTLTVEVNTPFTGQEHSETIRCNFADTMYIQGVNGKTVLRIPLFVTLTEKDIKHFTLKQDPVTKRPCRIVLDIFKYIPVSLNDQGEMVGRSVSNSNPQGTNNNTPSEEDDALAREKLLQNVANSTILPKTNKKTPAYGKTAKPVVGTTPVRVRQDEEEGQIVVVGTKPKRYDTNDETSSRPSNIISDTPVPSATDTSEEDMPQVTVSSIPTNQDDAKVKAYQKGQEAVSDILSRAKSQTSSAKTAAPKRETIVISTDEKQKPQIKNDTPVSVKQTPATDKSTLTGTHQQKNTATSTTQVFVPPYKPSGKVKVLAGIGNKSDNDKPETKETTIKQVTDNTNQPQNQTVQETKTVDAKPAKVDTLPKLQVINTTPKEEPVKVTVSKKSSAGKQAKHSEYRTKGGIKGKIITIDPGHGGADPGAVSEKNTYEKTITLAMAKKLKQNLEKLGAVVYMTRNTDTEVAGKNADDEEELQARVDIAENEKSDLFISLHINASVNRKAAGISTYYFAKTGFDNKLANCIHKQLTANFKLTDMGVREANFYVTKRCSMPAVLMELGFLSNEKEEKTIKSNWFHEKSMDLVANGIKDYFR